MNFHSFYGIPLGKIICGPADMAHKQFFSISGIFMHSATTPVSKLAYSSFGGRSLSL